MSKSICDRCANRKVCVCDGEYALPPCARKQARRVVELENLLLMWYDNLSQPEQKKVIFAELPLRKEADRILKARAKKGR